MLTTDELVEETQRHIERNLNPLLSVKVVAAAMNTDPPDLDRLFRRANGITIKKYIDARCKNEILERLKAAECKGCALAQEFGFKTDQAFYRWVLRVFGIPFRELAAGYRDEVQKK
jgi:methylphosphotriester-DNA--protein-cysteine methyltransferase